MLGESMTARNSSSWWISIYLLPLAPAAHTGGPAPESSIFVFRIRERTYGILHCGQVLAASSTLMYPPNFVTAFFRNGAPRTLKLRCDAMKRKECFRNGWNRLAHSEPLHRLCRGHWLRAEKLDEDKHGLFPRGPRDTSLGLRAGIYFREPRRAGSHRHGGFRSKVRHRHFALLLGRRHPRDGVRRHLHDAFLLWFARALRTRVSAVALRRENESAKRHLVRHNDGFFFGHLDVRHRQACSDLACPGWPVSAAGDQQHPNIRFRDSDIRADCARVHVSWRIVERHLQRGGAVFSDRRGILAAHLDWLEKRGRLDGIKSQARPEFHALVGRTRPCAHQPARRRMVWLGDGIGFCPFVWLLVHGFSRGAASDGGEVHERGAAHAVDRCRPENAVSRSGHPAGINRRRAADAACGSQRKPYRDGAAARARHHSL